MMDITKNKVVEPIIIAIVIFTIILVVLDLFPEIGNNDALIIEICIGVVLVIIIYSRTRKNDKKIEEIICEQEKARKEREYGLLNELCDELEQLYTHLRQLQDTENPIPSNSQTNINSLAEKIERLQTSLHGFYDNEKVEDLKTTLALVKKDDSENGVIEKTAIATILKRLEPPINDLSRKLKRKTNIKFEKSGKESSLTTSTDRTVYPIDSVIHVRVRGDQITKDDVVILEIFDSENNRIVSRTSKLEFSDNPNLIIDNIFEFDFPMTGKGWKINGEYTVRATCGGYYAEDGFAVDQRMPFLQSDKPVYMIGDDMVITVIDPDADKDNDMVEYVGDQEYSKLVIKSPYGEIDGYRLRETGKSTGIFQGILGILRVRKDGLVVPREFGGKIINKIQGTGISNGFIGGAPGDKLTAIYTNKTGTTELEFYISDFGAAVELDKKTYSTSDVVHITVIAPDLNSNSDKIEEIGLESDCVVSIRTSIDKIKRYKLIETGADTGIFTGKIRLKKQNSSIESKGEYTVGEIFCADEDFVEVSLRMFEDEKVIGKSIITS